MDELTALFPDVADALGIDSVAVAEKDYPARLRVPKLTIPGVGICVGTMPEFFV
ncbi:hypothetical protein [Dickeya chrysanthemi]|uniref:hypothetical protein n=1 Tax=Dickeya chrysanthemi TaxID=556 RepID=UPI0030170405